MQCFVVTENRVVSKNLAKSKGAVPSVRTYVQVRVCVVRGSYVGLALPALKEKRKPGVEQRRRTPSVAWAANEKSRAPARKTGDIMKSTDWVCRPTLWRRLRGG